MKLPFHRNAGLVVVSATISGPSGDHTIRLAVDTGAVWTLIRPASLRLAGYEPANAPGRMKIATGSHVETVPWLAVAMIQVADHSRRNLRVLSHDLPAAIAVDGLLGLNFFAGRRLTLDLRENTIEID